MTGGESWPTLEAVVRAHLLATCERCGWNLPDVADALGVCQKTVYNYLHRYEADGLVVHESAEEGGKRAWRVKSPG